MNSEPLALSAEQQVNCLRAKAGERHFAVKSDCHCFEADDFRDPGLEPGDLNSVIARPGRHLEWVGKTSPFDGIGGNLRAVLVARITNSARTFHRSL